MIEKQDFDQNRFIFIDGNDEVYSPLLHINNRALRINGNPRHRLTTQLGTKYDPECKSVGTVDTLLKAVSNNDSDILNFLLIYISQMMVYTRTKLVLYLHSFHSHSGKSTLSQLIRTTIGRRLCKEFALKALLVGSNESSHDERVL